MISRPLFLRDVTSSVCPLCGVVGPVSDVTSSVCPLWCCRCSRSEWNACIVGRWLSGTRLPAHWPSCRTSLNTTPTFPSTGDTSATQWLTSELPVPWWMGRRLLHAAWWLNRTLAAYCRQRGLRRWCTWQLQGQWQLRRRFIGLSRPLDIAATFVKYAQLSWFLANFVLPLSPSSPLREGYKVLQSACLFACVSTCMSQNGTFKLPATLCACCLWPWLGRLLMTLQLYNTLCTSGFLDDVMFSRDKAYVMYGKAYGWGKRISVRQVREGRSNSERGGASVLRFLPSLRCLPLTDFPWP